MVSSVVTSDLPAGVIQPKGVLLPPAGAAQPEARVVARVPGNSVYSHRLAVNRPSPRVVARVPNNMLLFIKSCAY